MNGQLGIPFELRKHWRKMFDKEAVFFYKRSFATDDYFLARFSIPNIIRWYFYQILISFVYWAMNPICRLADKYWRVEEGADYIRITGREMRKVKKPNWFVLGRTS